jgi:hypothetical protein
MQGQFLDVDLDTMGLSLLSLYFTRIWRFMTTVVTIKRLVKNMFAFRASLWIRYILRINCACDMENLVVEDAESLGK